MHHGTALKAETEINDMKGNKMRAYIYKQGKYWILEQGYDVQNARRIGMYASKSEAKAASKSLGLVPFNF